MKKTVSIGLTLLVMNCGSVVASETTPGQAVSSVSVKTNLSAAEQANADFTDVLRGDALLAALRQGGYVVYFRHATTEKDYADQADPKMSLQNCDSQRKLSLQGIKESYAIGLAFAEKKIPIGEIITSEYCRSWKTANYAFGREDRRDSRLNFLPYEEYSDALVQLMKKNVTPLLSARPAAGVNTVIVGHDDIFEAATGIYPEPQGIAYVIKPDGQGGFELIANLLPAEWGQL